MREYLREQLKTEMTRRQFIQCMAGLLLAVFGFRNLLAFMGVPLGKNGFPMPKHQLPEDSRHGFGSRKFGA